MTGFEGHLPLKKNVRNLTAQFEMISQKSRSSVEIKSQNSRRSEEMGSQKSRSVETQSQKSRAVIEAQSQNSRVSRETRSQKARSEELKSQKSGAETQSQNSRIPEEAHSQKSKVSEGTHSQSHRSAEVKLQKFRRSVGPDNHVNKRQEVPSSKLEDSTADDQYHETQRLLRNLKNRRRKWNKEPITKEQLEGIVKEYSKEAEDETNVLDSCSPTNGGYNPNTEKVNDAKIEVSDNETERNEETEDIDVVDKDMVLFTEERVEAVDKVNEIPILEIPDSFNFTQAKPHVLSNTGGRLKLSSCIRYLLDISLTGLFLILSTRLLFFS